MKTVTNAESGLQHCTKCGHWFLRLSAHVCRGQDRGQPISRPASEPATATTDRRNHSATRPPGIPTIALPGTDPATNGSRAGANPEPQSQALPGGKLF
jgi:hypothetical protein